MSRNQRYSRSPGFLILAHLPRAYRGLGRESDQEDVNQAGMNFILSYNIGKIKKTKTGLLSLYGNSNSQTPLLGL